jgi:hypothetical protein
VQRDTVGDSGSADLAPSNLTLWSGSKPINEDTAGNYIHYGVREFRRQVSGAAEEFRQQRTERFDGVLRGFTAGDFRRVSKRSVRCCRNSSAAPLTWRRPT